MRKRTVQIDPNAWVQVANERRPKLPQTTEWFDGTTAPTRAGWYERHFTDSILADGAGSMQWWDGEFWRNRPDGTAHWRQVGDYPAWRGLAKPWQCYVQFDNSFALVA